MRRAGSEAFAAPLLAVALLLVSGVVAWGVAASTEATPHQHVVLSQAAAIRLARGVEVAQVGDVGAPVAAPSAAQPASLLTPQLPAEDAPEMDGHANGDKAGVEYVLREEEGTIRRVEVVPLHERRSAPAVLSPFMAPLNW